MSGWTVRERGEGCSYSEYREADARGDVGVEESTAGGEVRDGGVSDSTIDDAAKQGERESE